MSGDEEVVIVKEVRAGDARSSLASVVAAQDGKAEDLAGSNVGRFQIRPSVAARRNRRNAFEEDRRMANRQERVGERRAELEATSEAPPEVVGSPGWERKKNIKKTRNKKQIFLSDSEEDCEANNKSPPPGKKSMEVEAKKAKLVVAKEARESLTLQGFLVGLQGEQEVASQAKRKAARKMKRMASAEKRRAELAAIAETPAEAIRSPGDWEFVTKGRQPTPRVVCPVGSLKNQEACRVHRARPSLNMLAEHLRKKHGVSEVVGRGCGGCGAPEVRVADLHLHFHCGGGGAAPPAQPSLPVEERHAELKATPEAPPEVVCSPGWESPSWESKKNNKKTRNRKQIFISDSEEDCEANNKSPPLVKTPALHSSKPKAKLSLTQTPVLQTFAFSLPADLSRVEEAGGVTGIRVRTDIFRPSALVAGIEENNNHFTFSKPMEFAIS